MRAICKCNWPIYISSSASHNCKLYPGKVKIEISSFEEIFKLCTFMCTAQNYLYAGVSDGEI